MAEDMPTFGTRSPHSPPSLNDRLDGVVGSTASDLRAPNTAAARDPAGDASSLSVTDGMGLVRSI